MQSPERTEEYQEALYGNQFPSRDLNWIPVGCKDKER
jgi:hypothetical protein